MLRLCPKFSSALSSKYPKTDQSSKPAKLWTLFIMKPKGWFAYCRLRFELPPNFIFQCYRPQTWQFYLFFFSALSISSIHKLLLSKFKVVGHVTHYCKGPITGSIRLHLKTSQADRKSSKFEEHWLIKKWTHPLITNKEFIFIIHYPKQASLVSFFLIYYYYYYYYY